MYLNIDSTAGIVIGLGLLFIAAALVAPDAVAGAFDTVLQLIADVLAAAANALSGGA